jgi:predicted nucleic acid-binding protein
LLFEQALVIAETELTAIGQRAIAADRSDLLFGEGALQHAAQLGNKQLDLAIAATALEHGLIVVTRNVSDFEPTGVPILNPFNAKPHRKK